MVDGSRAAWERAGPTWLSGGTQSASQVVASSSTSSNDDEAAPPAQSQSVPAYDMSALAAAADGYITAANALHNNLRREGSSSSVESPPHWNAPASAEATTSSHYYGFTNK